MCNIRKYPDHYSKADWILRVKHINKETAGYELLRRAIVIWEIEGSEISEKALKGLKENVTQSQKNKLIEKELLRRVRESASS